MSRVTQCQCVLFGLLGSPLCGEPVVAQVVLGCVHEHIERDWLCSRHIMLAKRNDLICSDCKTGGSSHSCRAYALDEVHAAGAALLRHVLLDDLGEAS